MGPYLFDVVTGDGSWAKTVHLNKWGCGYNGQVITS